MKEGEMPDGDGEGQVTEQTQSQDGDGDASDDEDFDKERAMATIRALRAAEKTLKGQLKEVSERTKTEEQRREEELARLRSVEQQYQAERRDNVTREKFIAEAQKQKAIRPDVVFRIARGEGLETDDDGNPTNMSAVFRTLRTNYPELFGAAGDVDGSAGRQSANGTTGMSQLIRRAAGRE